MKKRFLTLLLSLCMAFTLLPASALAAETDVMIGTTVLEDGKYYPVSGGALGTPNDAAPAEPYVHFYCFPDGEGFLSVHGDVALSTALYIPQEHGLYLKGSGNFMIDMTAAGGPAVHGSGWLLTDSAPEGFTGDIAFKGGTGAPAVDGASMNFRTDGAITLEAGSGGGLAIDSAENIVLFADVFTINGGIQADIGLMLNSLGDILINGGIQTSNFLSLKSSGGGILINGGVCATDGQVNMEAKKSVTITGPGGNGPAVEATANIAIIASEVIDISGGVRATNGGAHMQAKSVAVTGAGGDYAAEAANYTVIIASEDISINGGVRATDGEVYMDAGSVAITGPGGDEAAVQATKQITILADKDISIFDTNGPGVHITPLFGECGTVTVVSEGGSVRFNGGDAPEYFNGYLHWGNVTETGIMLPLYSQVKDDSGKHYFEAGNGYVLYDKNEQTLTLDNAGIEVNSGKEACAIGYFDVEAQDESVDLHIILRGESSLCSRATYGAALEHRNAGRLIFSGTGSLVLEGGYAAAILLDALNWKPLPSNPFVLEGSLKILEPDGAYFAKFGGGVADFPPLGTVLPQGETIIDVEEFSNVCKRVVIGISQGGGESGGERNVAYHSITATAAEGGAITPAGKATVREGASKTYVITANSGYVLSDLIIDGVSVSAVPSYTFRDIDGDHTIRAVFAPALTPTVPATGGGSGPLPCALFVLAALCGMGAAVYRRKRAGE